MFIVPLHCMNITSCLGATQPGLSTAGQKSSTQQNRKWHSLNAMAQTPCLILTLPFLREVVPPIIGFNLNHKPTSRARLLNPNTECILDQPFFFIPSHFAAGCKSGEGRGDCNGNWNKRCQTAAAAAATHSLTDNAFALEILCYTMDTVGLR